MEIIPADSVLFRSSIEALKEFLPSAQLRISSEGIGINGMDTSHVGFVDYFLSRRDCTSLRIPSPMTIGVNMVVLARVLSNVGSGDKLTVSTNKTKDKLVVGYTNDKVSKKALYEVPVLDITEDSLELPDMTYAATIEAKTSDVFSSIKEVGHFGDAITFTLDEDGFHISAVGDIGSAKQTLENTDDRNMSITEDSVTASFGTKYVLGIMKGGASLSSSIKIEFESTQPMRTSFGFGSASHFVAYLAPKITDS